MSAALRLPVPTPAPYLACVSAVTGGPELRPVALAEPIPQATLSPALTAMISVFDRLDAAGALIGGVQQAAQLTQQHHALSRIRAGQQIEMSGVFTVVRAFHILGSHFPVGVLLDRSVMADGLLYRFWQGRNIRPLETAAAA